MEPIAPDVGGRIRALREQRKLSLRALAKQCDLSVNAISMIERGENSPTVSSLQTLAAALGVKITAFFEAPHDYAVVLVRRAQRLGTQSGGVLMESLGIGLANQQLEPFMVTVEPGSRAGVSKKWSTARFCDGMAWPNRNEIGAG